MVIQDKIYLSKNVSFEESYIPSGVLEKILVKGIRLQGDELKHKNLRFASKAAAFYLEGGLFGKGREFFAGELGLSDSDFTKAHSITFGVCGMLAEGVVLYFGGNEVKSWIPGMLSDIFHVSYNIALGFYIGGLGVGQNLWRYSYAQKKDKGVGAVGVIPLIMNTDYYIPRVYRILRLTGKKNLNKIKRRKRKTY